MKLKYTWFLILLCCTPPDWARDYRRYDKGKHMGADITTKWGGVDGNAALSSNWTNGLPRGTGDKIIIPKTSKQAITSNLGSIPAEETLTLSGNAVNGNQVVIDAKTYTWKTAITGGDNVDGNVKVGAAATNSIDNLIAAINLASGGGSTYAANMTVHPTAYATAETGDTMDAIAKTAGTAGNSLVTTDNNANMSWGDTTMSGGAATGLAIAVLFVEKGNTKDIMTSGTGASVDISTKIQYRGNGTFYWTPSLTGFPINFVCDSSNLINAITISGTVQSGQGMEIIRGHVINNSTGAYTGEIYVLNSQSFYTSPSSAGTLGSLWQIDGVSNVGAQITTLYMNGGELTKTNNSLGTLIMDGGSLFINNIASSGQWRVLGGVLDARGSVDAVSIFSLVVDESKAVVLQNKDFNTWSTRIIGE